MPPLICPPRLCQTCTFNSVTLSLFHAMCAIEPLASPPQGPPSLARTLGSATGCPAGGGSTGRSGLEIGNWKITTSSALSDPVVTYKAACGGNPPFCRPRTLLSGSPTTPQLWMLPHRRLLPRPPRPPPRLPLVHTGPIFYGNARYVHLLAYHITAIVSHKSSAGIP